MPIGMPNLMTVYYDCRQQCEVNPYMVSTMVVYMLFTKQTKERRRPTPIELRSRPLNFETLYTFNNSSAVLNAFFKSASCECGSVKPLPFVVHKVGSLAC